MIFFVEKNVFSYNPIISEAYDIFVYHHRVALCLALCLIFRSFYPNYAYSCYAYKKISVFNNIDLASTDLEPLIFLIIMKQKLRKLISVFFILIVIKTNVLQAQNP